MSWWPSTMSDHGGVGVRVRPGVCEGFIMQTSMREPQYKQDFLLFAH